MAEDYESYVDTLRVLTTVGEVTPENFTHLLQHWHSNQHIYRPHVIADENGKVVATGMLLVERKLIHECGSVGHIEDIAVSADQQGKNLGRYMIEQLTQLANDLKCYKVILDCSESNCGFYEKCGYSNAGCEMTKRF